MKPPNDLLRKGGHAADQLDEVVEALSAHDAELSQLRQKCDYLERFVKNLDRALRNHLNTTDPQRYTP